MFGDKDSVESRRVLQKMIKTQTKPIEFFQATCPIHVYNAGKKNDKRYECHPHTNGIRERFEEAFKKFQIYGSQIPRLTLLGAANHSCGHQNLATTSAKNCFDKARKVL